ncbi:MAG: hypothetical protein BGO78_14395 [Chloroflexi bacterium 44-23]|nr:MAG: hypothetical protein BGO78_14395 [Chloroflexi bacterium 44-23]
MAEWEALKIHDVVQDISDNLIVLPVIQRSLVWDEEKMELLFDSLLKGNSFGGIMSLEEEKGAQPLFAFRQFSKEGELHDSNLPSVLDNNTTLIIDGQQRLQAFYMGLKGGVNGKNLYLNLVSQIDYDFEFAGQTSDLATTRKEDNIEIPMIWYLVPDLYTRLHKVGNDDYRVSSEIIKIRNIQNETLKELVISNVKRFERAIFGSKSLGISKVFIDQTNPDGERRRMVELFRRLNDGGTRLSAFDLAASALKGFDYRLEGFLRHEIPQFADIGFGQDEVIKLIFLLQDNHTKEVTDIKKEDAEFTIQNAPRIIRSLEVLRQLLKDSGLYEYYNAGGRSVIPLYFVAYHIFYKNGTTDSLSNAYSNYDANNPDFTNIRQWLYISLLNGVFSRGKGWIPYITGVRKILNTLSKYKGNLFPAEELFSIYESHPLIFNREISEPNLANWDMTFAFYLMYNPHGTIGRDIDHIQPKSLLQQANISAKKIHSLSNYQLLDQGTNRVIKRAKELNKWLADWKETELNQYLEKHLIPQDPNLWLLDNFDAFLSERSKMIVEKIQQAIPTVSKESHKTESIHPQVEKPTVNMSGAAQLTKSQRDPEKWLSEVADQNGCGHEFRQIVGAMRSVGLYARFQNNWWIVMFTPQKNRNHSLFEVGADLMIWIYSNKIANYLDSPIEDVKKKLDFGKQLDPKDVPQWVENLQGLFSTKT